MDNDQQSTNEQSVNHCFFIAINFHQEIPDATQTAVRSANFATNLGSDTAITKLRQDVIESLPELDIKSVEIFREDGTRLQMLKEITPRTLDLKVLTTLQATVVYF